MALENVQTGDASNVARQPRIVVVDDEELVGQAVTRTLVRGGFAVETFLHGKNALERIAESEVDVVVSDISMPGYDGIELLRAVRRRSLDTPVILVTGNPSLVTAMDAVEHGAFRYLLKPFETHELISAVTAAVKAHDLARLRRRMVELAGDNALALGDLAGLDVRFDAAIASLFMLHQPIVSVKQNRIYGYEALVRSDESTLATPLALLDAAERLDRLEALSRAIRMQHGHTIASLPPKVHLFVNLHPRDLLDELLYAPESPLARAAHRVVLEITERAPLEKIPGVRERMARLRALGYRIALDDVGAGYAGLTSFTLLEPDIVKLDMALVRNIDRAPAASTLVESLVSACDRLGIIVVAEGVETEAERATLAAIGCDLMQGHGFCPPGPNFPQVPSTANLSRS